MDAGRVRPGEDGGKLGEGFWTAASYEPHHMVEAAITGRRLWTERNGLPSAKFVSSQWSWARKASNIFGSAAFMACGLNSRPKIYTDLDEGLRQGRANLGK